MASVKVVARFRPANSIERRNNADKYCVVFGSDGGSIRVNQTEKIKKNFQFDYVFQPTSTQQEVFECCAKPLVGQVMKGFNVTMFAYGQTGSGKTFSMEGTEDMPGLIPRMVDDVFDQIMNGDDLDENLEFLVRVSYVEIYNEKIRDLLEPANVDLRVREHKDKGVYIEEAAKPYVGGPEETLSLMASGHLNRAVTSTGMNDESSRSHAVFMLVIEQKDMDTEAKKSSKLMLVDLAGSEKVRKTNVRGKALREAQNINRSLSCLGMVINCLTQGKTFIPYRDSKLTRLLSDSLGGNSKTSIIVTASPCIFNCEETISTLRFGTNCKRVKNKPKINQELSVAEYKKIVAGLQRRIEKLEAANNVLLSQVSALKKALLSGASGVDIEALLQSAEQTSGVKLDKQAKILTEKEPGQDDHEQQVMELEEMNENLEDQIQDLKNELEIAEGEREQFRQDVDMVGKQLQDMQERCKKLQNQTGQLNFYREKVEYMEKEHKLEIEDFKKRLREMRNREEDGLSSRVSIEENEAASVKLKEIEQTINKEQPVPWETFAKFRKQQEKKFGGVIANMKTQLEESKNTNERQNDIKEIENLAELSSDERAQTLSKLLAENHELRRGKDDMNSLNEKYSQQMKAFAQREQYNDKLRRNWQTQLRQMEQALLLSNQINNQNRAKYQQTITEKDSEIAKLRAYVTHQLHRQRTMRRGNRLAKPITRKGAGEGPKRIVRKGKSTN